MKSISSGGSPQTTGCIPWLMSGLLVWHLICPAFLGARDGKEVGSDQLAKAEEYYTDCVESEHRNEPPNVAITLCESARSALSRFRTSDPARSHAAGVLEKDLETELTKLRQRRKDLDAGFRDLRKAVDQKKLSTAAALWKTLKPPDEERFRRISKQLAQRAAERDSRIREGDSLKASNPEGAVSRYAGAYEVDVEADHAIPDLATRITATRQTIIPPSHSCSGCKTALKTILWLGVLGGAGFGIYAACKTGKCTQKQ
jgi:hypothetical protein